MIFMQHKETGKIFENIACDPFGHTVTLQAKDGEKFDADERNYEYIFKNNCKYQACLEYWNSEV